jgi:hypothetical protein
MNNIDNYGRFYGLLKRLPGADKETLVRQFTGNRTEHLRQMTYKEYDLMCREMERVAGYDERRAALLKEKRKARSGVLHQMQLWGVNTADWKAVDRFCEDKRIAGKAFRFLDTEELSILNTKLRTMNRKKDN